VDVKAGHQVRSFSTGAREASSSVVSLAFRWTAWGASVSAIEEQTGQPADQDGPNMKW
jgi:hypothetical protein